MKHLKLNVLLTVLLLTYSISYPQSWVQQTSGTVLNLYSIYFINNNTGFIGSDSGKILKTTNGGNNWLTYNTFVGSTISAIHFVDVNTGFAGTNNKVLKTTNSGNSWDTNITGGGKSISFINSNTGYALRQIYQPVIWKTTNTGSSWDSIGIVPAPIGPVNKIVYKNESTGYSCGNIYTMSFNFYNAFIMKTTNSGMNWGGGYYSPNMLNGATVFDISLISDSIFAAGYESSNNYLYRSYNNGLNWNLITLPYRMNSLKFINSSTGWLIGINGKILYTENAGNSFYEQISGTSAALNQIVMLNINTGYIAGNNGVILKTTNGGVTAIQQTGTAIPEKFTLSQNFPNPFNPVTRIDFDIPNSSFTKLVIFDQLGREIETLVNEQLLPGSYKYEWNAADYPSGIYFYKLQAGDFVETKKMVLVK